MNKTKSSFFKVIIIVITTVTPLLFTYLFSIQGVKELNAQKNKKLEELREKENKLEIRKVEYKKLTSEDEIVGRAKNKFDLVRIDHLDKISIYKNKIENIKKLIANKYD